MSNALKRLQKKSQAMHGKRNPQHLLNTVLWKIIMQNGGAIKILCSELKKLPAGAAVQSKHNQATDSITLTAMVRESTILLPNDGIISGGPDE